MSLINCSTARNVRNVKRILNEAVKTSFPREDLAELLSKKMQPKGSPIQWNPDFPGQSVKLTESIDDVFGTKAIKLLSPEAEKLEKNNKAKKAGRNLKNLTLNQQEAIIASMDKKFNGDGQKLEEIMGKVKSEKELNDIKNLVGEGESLNDIKVKVRDKDNNERTLKIDAKQLLIDRDRFVGNHEKKDVLDTYDGLIKDLKFYQELEKSKKKAKVFDTSSNAVGLSMGASSLTASLLTGNPAASNLILGLGSIATNIFAQLARMGGYGRENATSAKLLVDMTGSFKRKIYDIGIIKLLVKNTKELNEKGCIKMGEIIDTISPDKALGKVKKACNQ